MDRLGHKKIAIIGQGSMGKAFLKGLLQRGSKPANILVSKSTEDNKQVVKNADWVIIAVRPLQVEEVLLEIKDVVGEKLILSIATGASISFMKKVLGNTDQKIVRVMPNIPVAVNRGVIGIYAPRDIADSLKKEIIALLGGLGITFDLKREEDIDSLTLISACGPALVSYFINLLINTSQSLGITPNVSEASVLETIHGTLLYLERAHLAPTDLKQSVSTKGGITREIINSLDAHDTQKIFEKSMEKGRAQLETLKKSIEDNK